VRAQRRVLLYLAVAATLIAGLQGLTGVLDLALYAAPALMLLGLVVSGRFVGEERILARRRPAEVPRLRAALARRWPRDRARAFASLLERTPTLLRGPPAGLTARS
jgi:hypothetical protein